MTTQDAHDPTANVIAVVHAAVKRLDDLRDMEHRHQGELRTAEAHRIDALRAVDVGARSRAEDVAATAAGALANQVDATAEALRGQVEATKNAAAAALITALEPIQKDIQELRRNMYESVGGQVATRDVTVERRAQTATKISSLSLLIAGTGVLVAIILGVAGIVITLLLKG